MTIALNDLDFDLRTYRLIRKHVPRDATSFYRCLADRLLDSQRKHREVRQTLTQFCERDDEWKQFADILREEETAANPAMLRLAATCFSIPVILFYEQSGELMHTVFDPLVDAENESADSSPSPVCIATYVIDGQDQFDLVMTEDEILLAAVAQGFAYEALYAGVFGMDEKDIQNSLDQVIFVIDTDRIIYSEYILQMLRDKKFVRLKQRRKQLCYRSSSKTVHMPDELMSLPPVPYRVAKALDPAFYRNVEMDLWLQENEGRGTSGSEGPCGTPAISTRCLIASPHDPDRMLVCYVASKAQGFQVQVFVPSLQKRIRCDVRSLQVARPKRDRRPDRRSPDFRPGAGNEDWPHPAPHVINHLPARHYPLPLIPPNCPIMPAALLYPQLAPHFVPPHPSLLITSFPSPLPPVGPESPVFRVSPNAWPPLSYNWSPPCCLLSSPAGNKLNVPRFVSC